MMDAPPPPRPGVAGGDSAISTPPLGRRLCEVTANRASGGYRIVSLRDEEGPEPEAGQFYMLAAERWAGEGGRPYLPRARSVADVSPPSPHLPADSAGRSGLGLDFLLEAV